MAVHAVERCVRARKDESGNAAVVESGEPTVHAVAYLAIQRKTTPLMIDLCVDIIIVVAEIAVVPQSPEQADSRACMAVLAFQGGVRPHEWKPVRVPIYCSPDFEPASNGMTLLTVRSQLASMNIGVTVGALGPDIRKNQIEVTVPAIDVCVHFFKPVTGGAVIEIGRGTNG